MELKRVYNKHFPCGGYPYLTFYPWVFIREGAKRRYTAKANRHETTHAHQQVETLWILFLMLYGLEWLVKYFFCKFDGHRAYRSISFEQEAYEHEDEVGYNHVRHHYAWVKYIFSLVNC